MAHIMTGSEIRSSFLEFFQSKQHAIVPSSNLLPDSPNLLFTNAGMNQFVPIFLGRTPCPYTPRRAADTQKCIRAGGKHNDLEDVGLDTYHHTFFEMLGNWSFGDYFKKEAIAWAWELLVDRWKFPSHRIYATIYQPDKDAGDPAERDEEAWNFWAEKFRGAGLDPAVHIVDGNKKDNFWMMGDTGPCGPCSELHIDLTPAGDTRGALVNKGAAECIEIWNLVFIQFNANLDGTFSPLPARHVDTGMGFERIASIIQGTKGFRDFANARISNYETDIFRPIFDEIEKLSGRKYGSTLPDPSKLSALNPQQSADVAFRVIADHLRTLSFAIADGIQPGNNDRNYVLRRILRRAVRYGRTLGFREPFFYKLTAVLARIMGDVFPELREKQQHVEQVLKREEEAFNRTLDKGVEMFEREAEHVLGSARDPRADSGDSPESSKARRAEGAKYSRRHLPHFERPWGKYMVTFGTRERRPLAESERDIVLECLLYPHEHRQYELYAACVLPDHVHLLFEPQIKENDAEGSPVFHSLVHLLQGIKSISAHRINKLRGTTGAVWEKESFDRLIRSESDLLEKFHYVCRNPFDEGLQNEAGQYKWLWTSGHDASGGSPDAARGGACAPRISGAFAFRLYDEQGFPLDLTELMARERGLTVDTEGFEALMGQQRARARAAQKKTVIELSEIGAREPTHFLGYDHDHAGADVQEVVQIKDRTAVVLNNSVCYAEMGGQVGDTGWLRSEDGRAWAITDTHKSGDTWLHFLDKADAPAAGEHVTISIDRPRRAAIQRHHTVTHLLHWALHEVLGKEATQKGSFVGPDKLTFDFNSAALTPHQIRDVERLVNERIVGNAAVSWTEVPHVEVKNRNDIMQFFGDKYGDRVRVVQIGGAPGALDGYSMELCAGTHARATGEIGLFRIVSEGAVAAGIRRIEALAGLEAVRASEVDRETLRAIAGKLHSPATEVGKKLEAVLARQKELEKSLKAAGQREAAGRATGLLEKSETLGSLPAIVADLGGADGDALLAAADALKAKFDGVIVLGGAVGGTVALVAAVGKNHTAKISAGKIIQMMAPIVGGRGGGRPDGARGAGKDASKLAEALAAARKFVAEA